MEPLLGTAMAYKNTLYMADNNVGMEKKRKKKRKKEKNCHYNIPCIRE